MFGALATTLATAAAAAGCAALVLSLQIEGEPRPAPTPLAEAPARVVSMNLCTDQLAMLVAAPGQLAAVSRVARDPLSSPLWRQAEALPGHAGSAEAILALRPDLVLAGAYDPPATLALLRRLGLRVEVFDLEASFADIRANVARTGTLLGRPARAAALIAGMDAELEAAPPGPRPRAAVYDAGGYAPGDGTLAQEILTAAGLANVAAGTPGLHRLPLEELILARPDLLVVGQDYPAPALAQTVLRHPAIRALGAKRARVAGNLWTCGTPLAARAVAALRTAAVGLAATAAP